MRRRDRPPAARLSEPRQPIDLLTRVSQAPEDREGRLVGRGLPTASPPAAATSAIRISANPAWRGSPARRHISRAAASSRRADGDRRRRGRGRTPDRPPGVGPQPVLRRRRADRHVPQPIASFRRGAPGTDLQPPLASRRSDPPDLFRTPVAVRAVGLEQGLAAGTLHRQDDVHPLLIYHEVQEIARGDRDGKTVCVASGEPRTQCLSGDQPDGHGLCRRSVGAWRNSRESPPCHDRRGCGRGGHIEPWASELAHGKHGRASILPDFVPSRNRQPPGLGNSAARPSK